MRKPIAIIVILALVVVISLSAMRPAATQPSATGAREQIRDIVTAVNAKIQTGANTEADFADELKRFEAAIASHLGEKTEDVAMLNLRYAAFYFQVLDDPEKSLPLIRQIAVDFPGTDAGGQAGRAIPGIEKMVADVMTRRALAVGTIFPAFELKDLAGHPLSPAGIKAKVVLIDFWATWCQPCVDELPNVLKTYQAYHGKGFEIIGISLDKDRDRLDSFLKKEQVPWPQFFDGKEWQNELAVKYAVNAIPCTYLLDGNGKIIGKDLRGEALVKAVKAAVERLEAN